MKRLKVGICVDKWLISEVEWLDEWLNYKDDIKTDKSWDIYKNGKQGWTTKWMIGWQW